MCCLCMDIKKKTTLFTTMFLFMINGCSFSNVFNSDLTEVNEYYIFLKEELNELEKKFLYKDCKILLSQLGDPIEIQDGAYFGFNEMCDKNKCSCQEVSCTQRMSDELWIYVYKNAKASRSVIFYIKEGTVVRIVN